MADKKQPNQSQDNKENRPQNDSKLGRFFLYLIAGAFQIVSLFASYEGIKQMFLADPIPAGIFAGAINIGLLFVWHEFQSKRKVEKDDGLAKRRSTSLFLGVILLLLSASLSSIGMYSLKGFKSGAETDANAEYSEAIRQTKEVFNKVKDIAAKSLDAQKDELNKNLVKLNRRLAGIRLEKNKQPTRVEIKTVQDKIEDISNKHSKLDEIKPNSNLELSAYQRLSEIQTQTNDMLASYGIDRYTSLSPQEIKILVYDQATNRNLYDQFSTDLRDGKPFAILSVVFGVMPDVIAVFIVFLPTPRRKMWLRVRDSKRWTKQLWQELFAPVDLPVETPVEVIVNNDLGIPLLRTFVPIDLTGQVSAEHFHDYFPQIASELQGHYEKSFENNGLVGNWQELLSKGEPILLTVRTI